jgi:hypothetical protein
MKRLGWSWFVGSLAVCGNALAQPVPAMPAVRDESVVAEQHPSRVDPRPPPAEPTPKRRWYGLPILINDAAAYGLLVTAFELKSSYGYALVPSLTAYTLGGPIVHGVRGHWGHAGLSLLTRAVLPVGGALVGGACSPDNPYSYDYDNHQSGNCGKGVAVFFVISMVLATGIDLAALSWEDVEPAPSLQPSLSVGKDAAWIGASGTF